MAVHVFWRGSDRSPFTYAGVGTATSASNAMPVEVVWSFEPSSYGLQVPLDVPNSPTWRRGPPPAHGETVVAREDGETAVYLMRLEGPVSELVDVSPGHAIIKIGMSGNVERRLIELNAGFPPGSKVRWALMRSRKFSTARPAWELEGKHLEELRREGRWIGGEFAMVPEWALSGLLVEGRPDDQ